MTAYILVVDDEPDVEALILRKYRHKIRDGAITFLFARDGVEALAALKANGQIDLVVTDINKVCRCCRSCRRTRSRSRGPCSEG
jgi:adenylate cyclase